jgi:Leucine-rich repeat (LRR) protein
MCQHDISAGVCNACSWGTSWGRDGTFRLVYGAAYSMSPGDGYAMQFSPVNEKGRQNKAKQELKRGNFTAAAESSNCVLYTTKKKMRLVKLHDLLVTMTPASGTPTSTTILADLLASNKGFVQDTAAANKTFRVCDSARDVLVAAVGADGADPQLEALLRIKEHIDKDGVLRDWFRASGANGGYCEWLGVNCTDGKVTAINLWYGTKKVGVAAKLTGLKGKLPPASAFQGLNGLTFITIGDQTTIQGTLPDDWSQLQQLQFLSVANNSLTGSIPSSWGSLENLATLGLWNNKLTGTIPDSFSALSALKELGLNVNLLSGSIPASLGSLKGLTDLKLFGNQLTGTIPDTLGALTSLKTLSLGTNFLVGGIPASLCSLTQLQILVLSFNKLTSAIPDCFGSLTSLQQLRLGVNSLNGAVPPSLGQLTKLLYLELAFNALSGTLPAELSNLSQLSYLALSTNKLTGTLPGSYQYLTQLTSLGFAENNLSGTVPASWSSMQRLREVYLYSNAGLSGCLPFAWKALLDAAGWDVENQILYGTALTGYCPECPECPGNPWR